MHKPRFRVTYEVVTDHSAMVGDAAYRGFLPRSGRVPTRKNNMPKNPALFTLRQVVDMLVPRGTGPIEADSCPTDAPRWLTAQITSDWERPSVSLSAHLEWACSPASARRIARLVGCYGIAD
jgi:hypothetical protein